MEVIEKKSILILLYCGNKSFINSKEKEAQLMSSLAMEYLCFCDELCIWSFSTTMSTMPATD